MKKFLFFLFCCLSLLFTSLDVYSFHHSSHHSFHHNYHHSTYRRTYRPALHHPTVHRSSYHRSSTPKVAKPFKRTTPIKRQKTRVIQKYNSHGILMTYLIISSANRHKNDTYMYKDKEYKLCPICHKTLIPLNANKCTKCYKRKR